MTRYAMHGRVGVLVPPENPTVEPEMVRLMPGTVSVHAQRLPVLAGDLRDRILGYNAALDDAIAGFGGLGLDCVYYAMTGGSYLMGREAELALVGRLRDAGTTFVPAGHAILEVLEQQGVGRVALVSPYPDWLTESAVEYWTGAGLEVVAVGKVPTGPGGIYALESREVVDVVRPLLDARPEALLLSGTGMPTLAAGRTITAETGVRVLSSSIASAAAILHRLVADRGPDVLAEVSAPSLEGLVPSRSGAGPDAAG